MSRPLPRRSAVLGLVVALGLSGCGGGSAGGTATPTVDPTEAQLQSQLDDLPTVDGAGRTDRTLSGASLTETFTVAAGTPACLQVLARLDAGGYEVVTGPDPGTPVLADTCRTAAGDPGTDTTGGTATVLARGGSQVALTWTATTYTLTVTES